MCISAKVSGTDSDRPVLSGVEGPVLSVSPELSPERSRRGSRRAVEGPKTFGGLLAAVTNALPRTHCPSCRKVLGKLGGLALHKYIRSRGMTHAEAAKIAGIRREALSMICQGNAELTDEAWERLSEQTI